jgi:hypothetical protein
VNARSTPHASIHPLKGVGHRASGVDLADESAEVYTTSAGKKDMPTRVPMSDAPTQTVESAPTWRVELALRSDAMVQGIRSIKLCVARSLDEHRMTQDAAATTQPAAAVASLQQQIKAAHKSLVRQLEEAQQVALRALLEARRLGRLTHTETQRLITAVGALHAEVHAVLLGVHTDAARLLYAATHTHAPSNDADADADTAGAQWHEVRSTLQWSWAQLTERLNQLQREVYTEARQYAAHLMAFCERVETLVDETMQRSAARLVTLFQPARPLLPGQRTLESWMVRKASAELQSMDASVRSLLQRIPAAVSYAAWGAQGAGNDEDEDDEQVASVQRIVRALPGRLDVQVTRFANRLEEVLLNKLGVRTTDLDSQASVLPILNSYRCVVLTWRVPLATALAEALVMEEGDVEALASYSIALCKVVAQFMWLLQSQAGSALRRIRSRHDGEPARSPDEDDAAIEAAVLNLADACAVHACEALQRLSLRCAQMTMEQPAAASSDASDLQLSGVEADTLSDAFASAVDVACEAAEEVRPSAAAQPPPPFRCSPHDHPTSASAAQCWCAAVVTHRRCCGWTHTGGGAAGGLE